MITLSQEDRDTLNAAEQILLKAELSALTEEQAA